VIAWPQILCWASAWVCLRLILHEFLIIIICDSWGLSRHSFLSKPLAKQQSQYTLFFAICKPCEPKIDFCQDLNLGWKFPTLPWDKKEEGSSKGGFYHLLVSDVHQNKKQKTQRTKSNKERKKKNQSIKDRKEQRKIEKENKFFGPNNGWTMYRVVKRRKRRGVIVTWLRHEGIGSDRPFKLLTKSLGLLSYSSQNKGEERGERPEQPKPISYEVWP